MSYSIYVFIPHFHTIHSNQRRRLRNDLRIMILFIKGLTLASVLTPSTSDSSIVHQMDCVMSESEDEI